MNLIELANTVHENNKLWWTDLETGESIDRNKGELLMLTISELSEAVEGIRKNLMDDKLPHRKMEEVEMADAKIRLLDFAAGHGLHIMPELRKVPDEVALRIVCPNKFEFILKICASIIHLYRTHGHQIEFMNWHNCVSLINLYCDRFGLDLDGAVLEKIEYNKTRKDHTREERLKENGKKF